MMKFILKWFVNTVSLLIVVKILSGIHIDKISNAIIAALVLGLVNAFLRPLIIIFTLPINIMSLGLFTFVINGLLFYFVAKLIEGFTIDSYSTAFIGSLLFSIISFLLNIVIKPKINIDTRNNNPSIKINKSSKIIDAEFKVEDD